MSQTKETHPIRNGIIATVAGGILLSLWPPFFTLVRRFATWIWKWLVTIHGYSMSKHSVYGWLIIILSLLSFITIIQLIVKLKKRKITYYSTYINDSLFGVDWHWAYVNNDIINLWCLCPNCQCELVYSEFIPDRYNVMHDGKDPKTDFICEKCDQIRASLAGTKNQALGTVEREIRRKIRTDEWKSVANKLLH